MYCYFFKSVHKEKQDLNSLKICKVLDMKGYLLFQEGGKQFSSWECFQTFQETHSTFGPKISNILHNYNFANNIQNNW